VAIWRILSGMNARSASCILPSIALAMLCACAGAAAAEPVRTHVHGADLSYIERGSGAPIILLHGGVGDYSSWQPQLEPFARHFRVIAYSRRFSFPNSNPLAPQTYSPWTDVEDLAALIRRLRLHDVRLVGQSAGAFVALAFAVKHPEMVHSLVLSEPPAHQLIRGTAEGEFAYQDFMAAVMTPAASSFKSGDVQGAMKVFVNGMAATDRFTSLLPDARADVMRNARSIEALCLSADPFPAISRTQLSQLRIRALIVTGENTIRIHKLVNAELIRLLPNVRSVTIPGAGHGSPRENSLAFNEAVLGFFALDRAPD
jgi:pimeloyl-ACP methyl ester carboxylesterase